ncbi:hypothetical protein LR48_Vigan01g081800 [Vigna angularis]|uniref:Uncharacterized protein n=1 Tax=Phaseolus angularis TaxID=3914 RepID=A0A0L9TKZ8_PHAAN|nr:hypothetical protein LR48_Vigan01g081800 [Vigna angularis]
MFLALSCSAPPSRYGDSRQGKARWPPRCEVLRKWIVEELGVAGLEDGEEFGVGVGLDKGVAELRDDYEAILLYAGDADGFLDGGRGEAFSNDGGYEECVLVLEAEAVGEDVYATNDVKVAVL